MTRDHDADDDVRAALDAAIGTRDAETFEAALPHVWRVPPSRDVTKLLARAVVVLWHRRHEDVALLLQRAKDPVAIDALYEAATMKHEYLAYDDSLALARKCTWALADIGTEEAKAKLEALARCGSDEIEEYARRRLERWEAERGRKGRP